MEWVSNAKWPKGTLDYTGNISQDFHNSEGAAKSVCSHLERHGFGGERKIFPIETWVEPPKEK